MIKRIKESPYFRVILIAVIGIIEGSVLIYFWEEIVLYFSLTKDDQETGNIPNWLGTFITTLAVSPIAFLIWSFRNEDKRRDLQQSQENLLHTEENIRQADFHKIEEWATTFSTIKDKSETVNPESDEDRQGALQVAAIYQLLPYLKGEYGERFKRPALEIYRSLLDSWQWTEEEKRLIDEGKNDEVKKPSHVHTIHAIFRQEDKLLAFLNNLCKENNWDPLNLKGFKVSETTSDMETSKITTDTKAHAEPLPGPVDQLSADGSIYKDFSSGNYEAGDFSNSILLQANFMSAKLTNSNFKNAVLREARFYLADLRYADLTWADLRNADLRDANLRGANLGGANLYRADLRGANLTDATNYGDQIKEAKIDKNTILTDGSHWKSPEDDTDTDSESKSN